MASKLWVLLMILLFIPCAYAKLNDAIIYYSFDNSNGTDDSKHMNTANLIATPTFAAGKLGNAIYFDGIAQHTNTTNPSYAKNQTEFTICFWANLSTDGDGNLLSFEDYQKSGSYEMGLAVGTNLYYGDMVSNGGDFYFNPNDAKGAWYNTSKYTWSFIVMTFNGSQALGNRSWFYINNINIPVTNGPGGQGSLTPETEYMYLAKSPRWGAIKMGVDEVAIYNRTLTAAEITQLYNGGTGLNPYANVIPNVTYANIQNTGTIYTNSTVVAQFTVTDSNEDTLTTVVRWYNSTDNSTYSLYAQINETFASQSYATYSGVIQNTSTGSLVAPAMAVGQYWKANITTNDGSLLNFSKWTPSFKVSASPPDIVFVNISMPRPIYTNDVIHAQFQISHPNGLIMNTTLTWYNSTDNITWYAWNDDNESYINQTNATYSGVLQNSSSTGDIEVTNTAMGQYWKASITVYDGASTVSMNSSGIRIDNTLVNVTNYDSGTWYSSPINLGSNLTFNFSGTELDNSIVYLKVCNNSAPTWSTCNVTCENSLGARWNGTVEMNINCSYKTIETLRNNTAYFIVTDNITYYNGSLYYYVNQYSNLTNYNYSNTLGTQTLILNENMDYVRIDVLDEYDNSTINPTINVWYPNGSMKINDQPTTAISGNIHGYETNFILDGMGLWNVSFNITDSNGLSTSYYSNFNVSNSDNTPPNVTLDTPLNNGRTLNLSQLFKANIYSNYTNIQNMTIYFWDVAGAEINTSYIINGTHPNVSVTFNVTLPEATYYWNIKACKEYNGVCGFALSNLTFYFTSLPKINNFRIETINLANISIYFDKLIDTSWLSALINGVSNVITGNNKTYSSLASNTEYMVKWQQSNNVSQESDYYNFTFRTTGWNPELLGFTYKRLITVSKPSTDLEDTALNITLNDTNFVYGSTNYIGFNRLNWTNGYDIRFMDFYETSFLPYNITYLDIPESGGQKTQVIPDIYWNESGGFDNLTLCHDTSYSTWCIANPYAVHYFVYNTTEDVKNTSKLRLDIGGSYYYDKTIPIECFGGSNLTFKAEHNYSAVKTTVYCVNTTDASTYHIFNETSNYFVESQVILEYASKMDILVKPKHFSNLTQSNVYGIDADYSTKIWMYYGNPSNNTNNQTNITYGTFFGNYTIGTEGTFTNLAPTISSVNDSVERGTNQTNITWSVNILANNKIFYATNLYFMGTNVTEWYNGTLNPNIALLNLSGNTKWYYKLYSESTSSGLSANYSSSFILGSVPATPSSVIHNYSEDRPASQVHVCGNISDMNGQSAVYASIQYWNEDSTDFNVTSETTMNAVGTFCKDIPVNYGKTYLYRVKARANTTGYSDTFQTLFMQIQEFYVGNPNRRIDTQTKYRKYCPDGWNNDNTPKGICYEQRGYADGSNNIEDFAWIETNITEARTVSWYDGTTWINYSLTNDTDTAMKYLMLDNLGTAYQTLYITNTSDQIQLNYTKPSTEHKAGLAGVHEYKYVSFNATPMTLNHTVFYFDFLIYMINTTSSDYCIQAGGDSLSCMGAGLWGSSGYTTTQVGTAYDRGQLGKKSIVWNGGSYDTGVLVNYSNTTRSLGEDKSKWCYAFTDFGFNTNQPIGNNITNYYYSHWTETTHFSDYYGNTQPRRFDHTCISYFNDTAATWGKGSSVSSRCVAGTSITAEHDVISTQGSTFNTTYNQTLVYGYKEGFNVDLFTNPDDYLNFVFFFDAQWVNIQMNKNQQAYVIFNYPSNATLAAMDSDGDGLSDFNEMFSNITNPFSMDTDGDSYNDTWEITNGSNPHLWNSLPASIPDINVESPVANIVYLSTSFNYTYTITDANAPTINYSMTAYNGTHWILINSTIQNNGTRVMGLYTLQDGFYNISVNATDYYNDSATLLINNITIDTTACPDITNLAIQSNTSNSLYLNWTPIVCSDFNQYLIYKNGVYLTALYGIANQSYNSTGLLNFTLYNHSIVTNDSYGHLGHYINITNRTGFTATYINATAPVLSNLKNTSCNGRANDTFCITFDVDRSTNATILHNYGNLSQTAYNKSFNFTITVSNLTLVKYNITVFNNTEGIINYTISSNYEFTTGANPDLTPPNSISDLQCNATGASTATCTWSNSTSLDVAGFTIYLMGGYDSNVTSLTKSLTSLSGAINYSFGVEAYDANGNKANIINTTFITEASPSGGGGGGGSSGWSGTDSYSIKVTKINNNKTIYAGDTINIKFQLVNQKNESVLFTNDTKAKVTMYCKYRSGVSNLVDVFVFNEDTGEYSLKTTVPKNLIPEGMDLTTCTFTLEAINPTDNLIFNGQVIPEVEVKARKSLYISTINLLKAIMEKIKFIFKGIMVFHI